MRLVIDTNVIVSAFLSPRGIPARILGAWEDQAFELLVSEPILAEYQRALSYEPVRVRHRRSQEQIATDIQRFRIFAILIQVSERLEVIEADPADNKFLECAIAGGAEYIVSGDSQLQNLQEYRGIRILSPAVFLTVLERES